MNARRRSLRFALLALALVAVVGYAAALRVASVAAVQDALERDWEINFNAGGRPRALPARLDDAAESLIQRALGPEPDQLFLAQKSSRDTIWQERFRALFRGRITEMEIYYPGRLRDDLGAALTRFPKLRRLVIHKADFSDSDWAHVFAGLHRLPVLEELEIGSYELRDRTIEPLAYQRSLRKVSIITGRLGTDCAGTFARMPSLATLVFGTNTIDDGHEGNELPLPENQKLIREALPKVKVEFE